MKLQSLIRDFENIKMRHSETIKDYYTRINEVVTQMRAYGETLTDKRVVEKILIKLLEKYDSIVTTIEETKDLTTLSVTDLIGSLEAYEKRLNRHDESTLENAFQPKLNFRS